MTQAVPAQFGDVPIPEDVPYWENWYQYGAGPPMNQGGVGAYTIGLGFVMPFDGQLTVTSWVNGSFPQGLMAVSAWFDQSTPAPSSYFAGSFTDFVGTPGGTGWMVVSSMGQWRDLVKGQSVAVQLRVKVDLANVAWTTQSTLSIYRMQRY